MAKNDNKSLVDLRKIINSLKMSGLAHIDPEALDAINERIRNLPGPESLLGISGDARAMKALRNDVGEIMKTLCDNGVKDFSYKVRHHMTKNLPPRYKVLEWKKASVENIVKTSAKFDVNGSSEISDKLIDLSYEIMKNENSVQNIIDLSKYLDDAGYVNDADLLMSIASSNPFVVKADNVNNTPSPSNSDQTIWQEGSSMQYNGIVKSISDDLNALKKMTLDVQSGAKSDSMKMIVKGLLSNLDSFINEWTTFSQQTSDFTSTADKVISQTTANSQRHYVISQGAPAQVDENGQQLINNQPVFGNMDNIIGQLKNILVKDKWDDSISKNYMDTLNRIKSNLQKLSNLTQQILDGTNNSMLQGKISEQMDFLKTSMDRWADFKAKDIKLVENANKNVDGKEYSQKVLLNNGVQVKSN